MEPFERNQKCIFEERGCRLNSWFYLMMKVAGTCETSVNLYQTARCSSPEVFGFGCVEIFGKAVEILVLSCVALQL